MNYVTPSHASNSAISNCQVPAQMPSRVEFIDLDPAIEGFREAALAGLSRAQKIDILKRWELDARALQRATDESMSGGEAPLLDEVNRAVLMIDPENEARNDFGKAPTKI